MKSGKFNERDARRIATAVKAYERAGGNISHGGHVAVVPQGFWAEIQGSPNTSGTYGKYAWKRCKVTNSPSIAADSTRDSGTTSTNFAIEVNRAKNVTANTIVWLTPAIEEAFYLFSVALSPTTMVYVGSGSPSSSPNNSGGRTFDNPLGIDTTYDWIAVRNSTDPASNGWTIVQGQCQMSDE